MDGFLDKRGKQIVLSRRIIWKSPTNDRLKYISPTAGTCGVYMGYPPSTLIVYLFSYLEL